MSAESCDSALALSVGIRSKALTVQDLLQFKVLHKKNTKIWITEEKINCQLRSQLKESDIFSGVHA